MPHRNWKRIRKFWGLALALAFVTAAAALGVSLFLSAFSSHNPGGYEPKDELREQYLKGKPDSAVNQESYR